MSTTLTSSQIRRLSQEFVDLRELEKNGGGYRCHFNEADMSEFEITIIGPEHSPYEFGDYKVKFQIDRNYPVSPPLVTFVTPIFHPNISKRGSVCHELLKFKPMGQYDSNVTLTSILLSMQLLLANPNPDDPMNITAANMMKYQPVEFDQHVREMVMSLSLAGSMCNAVDNPLVEPYMLDHGLEVITENPTEDPIETPAEEGVDVVEDVHG